jgi:hypothetical protein
MQRIKRIIIGKRKYNKRNRKFELKNNGLSGKLVKEDNELTNLNITPLHEEL